MTLSGFEVVGVLPGLSNFAQNGKGPKPMQLVVVRAVMKAVRAATIIFVTSSKTFFLSMVLNSEG